MSVMGTEGPEPEEFGEEFGEEVEFEMIEDRGTQATIECPACGFIFDIDAHTNLNLEWNRPKKAMICVCPICQRRQK
jgi:uncharacterized Zn finger protein